jgi:ribosome recycling factor
MNEEVQLVYEMAKENMEKAIEHLDNELVRIRAGKRMCTSWTEYWWITMEHPPP